MKISLVILILLPLVFNQNIVVSPSTACKCQQFLSETGCNNNTLEQCQWNQKNQICQQQQSCGNITQQNNCLISKKNCYWNGLNCTAFTSCSKLTSQIGLICLQQNISCYGSNTTQCQSISSLPKCITFGIGICGYQGGYVGSNGLCTWNINLKQCVVATNCSQLQNDQVCNTYIQNACIWDYTNNACTEASCTQLSQQNCRFVVANLDQNQVSPCLFQNNQCFEASQNLLQIQDQCQTNTLLNYRWIGTQNEGICVSCAQQLFGPENKCSCEQYMFATNCHASQYCEWKENSCQDIPCTNVTNQLQCSMNKNCYWSLLSSNCQNFYSCNQLQGFNSLACFAQSINCPNEMNQSCTSNGGQCNQLPQPFCDGFVTNEGICYYDVAKQGCQNLKNCSDINDENICNQMSRLCLWSTESSKCYQLTCQNVKLQNQCTFVFKYLNQSDIQLCEWANNNCSNAKNILTLNEAQCSPNSQYTYMYTGSKCVKCISPSIILPQQCSCSQLYLALDCLANPLCQWNGQICKLQACLSIINQDLCVQNYYCQWTEYGCSDFQTCFGLTGSTPKDCISQSINCPYSDGVRCQNKYYYSPCASYSQPSLCSNQLGSDGLCIWNKTNGGCQVLQKCNQILTATYCGIYQYVCNWSNDQCNQSTCSTFTTPEQCKYYFQSLNSFTPIGCKWNITTNSCQQVGSTLTAYTSANCYQNTAKTARWSQTQNQGGVCISCGVKYLPNPYKCSCQQLISQLNCVQNSLCYWDQTLKACQEYECSTLAENICITSMKCMWSNKGCTTFISCNEIKGESIDECLSYSLYCPYNAGLKNCSSLKDLPKCEEHKSQDSCVAIQGAGKDICYWSYQFQRCTVLNSCSGLSQTSCEQYSLYCAWINSQYYGYCQERKCVNYSTKYSCTYVLSMTDPNLVQSCQWQNGVCKPIIIQQALDANTCFTNSNGTSRWTSESLTTGLCVPCNLPSYAVQYQNKCSCSQILNQSECQYPFCEWLNNQCVQNYCPNIRNQFECSQLRQCYWKISYNQCYTIPVQLNFCTTLKGNSSLECLAQSINCPSTLNGICQNSSNLQTCSSITTQAACANSIGQEGYCTYQNQACKVISSCSSIKSYNYCVGMQHFCTWNDSTNQCATITCSNIAQKEACTYIYDSMNSSSIQLCEWNEATIKCLNASSSSLTNKTIENCHIETGGTYHWSNTQNKGYCISCQLDLIKLPNTCSCNQLTNIECLSAKPKCRVNDSGSCIESECKNIFDQGNCSTLPSCMWSNQACIQFTSCSNLLGESTLDCLAQSTNCPGLSNGKCQSKQSLSSCSSNQTADQCTLGTPSSDGFCYWNTNQCQQIINCDAITELTQCDALYRICTWSTTFYKCVPFKCQDYKKQDQCSFVVVNFKNSYIELCQWQNKVCQQYTDKYYRFDEETCYQNSGHTYRWVSDDAHGSKCQECYSLLITFIMVIYLISF